MKKPVKEVDQEDTIYVGGLGIGAWIFPIAPFPFAIRYVGIDRMLTIV